MNSSVREDVDCLAMPTAKHQVLPSSRLSETVLNTNGFLCFDLLNLVSFATLYYFVSVSQPHPSMGSPYRNILEGMN